MQDLGNILGLLMHQRVCMRAGSYSSPFVNRAIENVWKPRDLKTAGPQTHNRRVL